MCQATTGQALQDSLCYLWSLLFTASAASADTPQKAADGAKSPTMQEPAQQVLTAIETLGQPTLHRTQHQPPTCSPGAGQVLAQPYKPACSYTSHARQRGRLGQHLDGLVGHSMDDSLTQEGPAHKDALVQLLRQLGCCGPLRLALLHAST